MSSSFKIYIIAGSLDQFKLWRINNLDRLREDNPNLNIHDIVYVTGRETFMGVSNPTGRFIGTWYHRSDIEEILFQLQCQGSLLDTQKMSDLLSIVEKNK